MQLRREPAPWPRPVPHPLGLPVAPALIYYLASPAIADTEVVCDFPHRLPPTIMSRQKFGSSSHLVNLCRYFPTARFGGKR